MSPPDIHVVHSTLLYQEKIWREQAGAMGKISSAANDDQWPGNAGYFVSAVNAYNAACQHIGALCGQGKTEMNNIADALKGSYATYQETENKITGQINQVGHH